MSVVYYRGPTALITDQVLEVWRPARHRYLISALHDVQVVRGSADPLAVGTAQVACSSAAVALASLLFVGGPAGWLLAGSLVVIPGVLSGVCWRLRHRELRLYGTYHGQPVTLYASRDPQSFGQIRRALQRAMEVHVTI